MHQPEKNIEFFPPLMITAGWNTHGGSLNKTMAFIHRNRDLCIRTKNPIHRPKKVGFSPPLIFMWHVGPLEAITYNNKIINNHVFHSHNITQWEWEG